jgi:carbamoyltransferase
MFAIAVNMHDHNWYDGSHHYQAERFSRRKHNIDLQDPHNPSPSREFFLQHFVPKYNQSSGSFGFTCSNLGKEFVRDLLSNTLGNLDFLKFKPKHLWDCLRTPKYYYIDHHQSHAAYAFLTSGFDEADTLAIDGRGWQFTCVFVNKWGEITDLSSKVSIGGLWNRISQDIGLGYLGAGKTMGLVGFGKFNNSVQQVIVDYLRNPNHSLSAASLETIKNTPREDVAYTLQRVTIELIHQHVLPLQTSSNICLAGGVAYNGYLNEYLTKFYKCVHVPPAVGDEGQSIGTYMHMDWVLNHKVTVPPVFSGANYIVDEHIFEGMPWKRMSFESLTSHIAKEIATGKIVGWYQGRSESGNRALGNRSILADPRNPNIKDIINKTIKFREDFRPFAPSVLEEHYQEYFDTNQPSPYMSRIVPVKSRAIPGVTHVDGTARIQTVNKQFNERFYQLIDEFRKITHVPMLLNTSFNCKEPIVETPEQAVDCFKKTGLDLLVIDNYVIGKPND